jgi:hypothetical protein
MKREWGGQRRFGFGQKDISYVEMSVGDLNLDQAPEPREDNKIIHQRSRKPSQPMLRSDAFFSKKKNDKGQRKDRPGQLLAMWPGC